MRNRRRQTGGRTVAVAVRRQRHAGGGWVRRTGAGRGRGRGTRRSAASQLAQPAAHPSTLLHTDATPSGVRIPPMMASLIWRPAQRHAIRHPPPLLSRRCGGSVHPTAPHSRLQRSAGEARQRVRANAIMPCHADLRPATRGQTDRQTNEWGRRRMGEKRRAKPIPPATPPTRPTTAATSRHPSVRPMEGER